MCGIAGYVQRRSDDAETLARMTERLRHRGPDGGGEWRAATADGWNIALGHRRLSIIDLAGGAQPLGNEDGSVQITFNGEIYNYRELRARLESQGHRFATHSDTETIVHHYEQHGANGTRDLNGMFAFAIWDHNTRQLLLARDRAGIKPLYYCTLPDGGIVFASELTALLEHPAVGRAIDTDGLASYFFADYIQPPHTIVRGVRKLEPGHWLTWRDGTISSPQPFWILSDVAPRQTVSDAEEDLADELWERLRTAVRRQLIADVPIGVFLSGGIDSSIVATLAQELTPEPIRTFSIRFEEPQFDESAYARQMATKLGSQHTEETLHAGVMLDTLDAALDSLDEPMADPSIVPTYLLSRLAARHVKVALGGDGGDELWAGYPTYRAHRYANAYRHLPRVLRDRAIKPAVAALKVKDGYQSFEWKAKRFALRWDDDPMLRQMRWMSSADLPDLPLLIPSFARLPAEWDAVLKPARGRDEMNSILALDFQTYLPGSVLPKVDRAAMAFGLEVRPPFLDNEMIDWVMSLPSHLKIRGTRSKYLLKKSASGKLPQEIIHRRKKGFGIPLSSWLNGPLRPRMQQVMRSSPIWETKLLNRATFVEWDESHQSSRQDHSKPLWSLIVLDHWMRRHI